VRRHIISLIALGFLLALIGSGWAQLPLTHGGLGTPLYQPQGVTFSSTAYATKGSALTGVSDGTSGLASVWVNITAAKGSPYYAFFIGDSGTAEYFGIRTSSSQGVMICEGWTSGNVNILSIRSLTVFTSAAAGAWKLFLCSWNSVTPRSQVYVTTTAGSDAVSDIGTIVNSSGTVVFSGTSVYLGGTTPGGSNLWNANIADLQVWFNVDVDISVAANRHLFVDSNGNAVNPAIAKAALGTPNILQTGAASSWQTNQGGGGGFTIQAGTITAASSNPP
jgi:hypothetical protein